MPYLKGVHIFHHERRMLLGAWDRLVHNSRGEDPYGFACLPRATGLLSKDVRFLREYGIDMPDNIAKGGTL